MRRSRASVPVIILFVIFGKCVFAAGEPDIVRPAEKPKTPILEAKRILPEEAIWSETVNGLQARIVLKRREVCNGTPIMSTYLVLKNVRNLSSSMKLVWSPEQMKCAVVDKAGAALPHAYGPYSGGGPGRMELVVPVRGEIWFDISHHGLGIPRDKAALMDFGPTRSWVIDPDGKEYFFKAELEFAKPKEDRENSMWVWHGRVELPQVAIPLKAEPIDASILADRIDVLGARMLEYGSDASDEAMDALSLIDDPRVVPWYLKAVATDRYSLKMNAIDRLARLEGDDAFGGLKIGMATQGKDIGHCSTPELAASSANNIRLAAVHALSRTSHPDAKGLLKNMTTDPDDGVRMTAMQALARTESAESLELLQKMSKDPSESVRREASRFLEQRAAKPDAGK